MSLFRIRLKELVEQTEKKQTEICKEIGITKQHFTNWKSGYNEPNIDDLIILAAYFGVSVDYLIGYENEDGTKNTNISNSFNNNNGSINFKA